MGGRFLRGCILLNFRYNDFMQIELETTAMTQLVRFDWAMKHLLRNKANFDILEGFLSELLKSPIKIEEIIESESNKNHESDKSNRVDLLARTTNGEKIIIEVQTTRQWDYLSRILYGTSKVVCEHIRAGDAYKKIRKVISVSIVFFDLGEGKDYLYQGTTSFKGLHFQDTLSLSPREKKYYYESDLRPETPEMIFPEYYLIKVMSFKERVQDKIDEWIYFFKNGEIEKKFDAQGLSSAKKKLDVLRLNEKERRAYESYQESLHDDASLRDTIEFNKKLEKIAREEAQQKGREEGRNKGREEGRKKGREEGLQEGREEGLQEGRKEGRKRGREEGLLKVAQSLKKAGMSDSEIAAHTQLSLDTIKNL